MPEVWDRRRGEVADAARRAGFSAQDADVLALASRPAARVVATRGDIAPGASCLGGLPDLPAVCDWPAGARGRMTFLGQINTADIGSLDGVDDWRSRPGLLSFFVDWHAPLYEKAAGAVIFTEAHEAPRSRISGDRVGSAVLPPSSVAIRPVMSPPMAALFDVNSDIELDYDLDQDDWAAWDRLYELLGCGSASSTAGHHQVFGNAWVVGDLDPIWKGAVMLAEDDEAVEDHNDSHRLLAQFTIDQDAGIDFGVDEGSEDPWDAVYFVTRSSDLADDRYDRVAIVRE